MSESIDVPATIEPVEESQYDGTAFDIGREYYLNLKFHEDELRLRVYPAEGEARRQYVNNSLSRDFFDSDQKIRSYGNDIATDIGEDATWAKSRLRDVRQYVEAAELEAIADDARQLIDRTEDVQAYQSAESLTVAVWLEAPEDSPHDGVRRLQFDGVEEWRTDSSETIRDKHYRVFLTDLAIADRDWQEVWNRWEDEMTLEQSESQGEADIIADRVMDVLQNRVAGQVYDFKDPVPNSPWNSYFEPVEESEFDEDTVWVQTRALRQILEDETQKGPSKYLGTLSGTLGRRDVKLAGSQRRRVGDDRVSLHPISADALGVDADEVLSEEDLEQSPNGDESADVETGSEPGSGVIEP